MTEDIGIIDYEITRLKKNGERIPYGIFGSFDSATAEARDFAKECPDSKFLIFAVTDDKDRVLMSEVCSSEYQEPKAPELKTFGEIQMKIELHDKALNRCMENRNEYDAAYYQGARDALRWVIGDAPRPKIEPEEEEA